MTMIKAPSNFRRADVKRAIQAARESGLAVDRVEVDPKTSRIVLITSDGEEHKLGKGSIEAEVKKVSKEKR